MWARFGWELGRSAHTNLGIPPKQTLFTRALDEASLVWGRQHLKIACEREHDAAGNTRKSELIGKQETRENVNCSLGAYPSPKPPMRTPEIQVSGHLRPRNQAC